MRVVIDTNCLLVIIPKVSLYRSVFDAYRSRQFELAVSTEVLDEYAEILGQRMTPLIADNLLELMDKQTNTIRIEIYYRWGAITEDYDDNKYVDCAVAAGADYIVTHDRHFNVLSTIEFPRVKCIKLDEFMLLLKS